MGQNFGFVKVAAAVPGVEVADCPHNVKEIEKQIAEAEGLGVQIVVFPELSVTAYTCADLFGHTLLLEQAQRALAGLLEATARTSLLCVVGMPVAWGNSLYNCAVAFQQGRILGVVPKSYLPNYKEFYEKRWFASGLTVTGETVELCGSRVPFGVDLLFESAGAVVGIELCEDLWVPIPPSSHLARQGADIILNLSATNELIGKHHYLLSLLQQQSARCLAGYVYASAGFGESSTDLVFAGNGIVLENGSILVQTERFVQSPRLAVSEIDVERLRTERRVKTSFAQGTESMERPVRRIPFALADVPLRLTRRVSPRPFVPSDSATLHDRCEEILSIQAAGLAKRLIHTRAQSAVIGISGGLDSTLALLVAVKALDRLGEPRQKIIGVTMPGFGTTGRTYRNAVALMQALGITIREISIREACELHFRDIGHDATVQDVTYENSQARERTQILMDIANQTGGLVIGTGDLSELALGWATYNGDHMSMYGVSTSIPKTLVKYLVHWVAENELTGEARDTLLDIVNTPISPELIPADENGEIKQKTEDLVGPYDLHDFFLFNMLRYGFSPAKLYCLARYAFDGEFDDATIKKWLKVFCRRFFNQQFKRSCLPDGPKVGSVSLSPRGDWRMPSDASSAMWLRECDEL